MTEKIFDLKSTKRVMLGVKEKYEQYEHHWDEWIPVKIVRQLKTKSGIAFKVNDETYATPSDDGFWTAFSPRNEVDTAIARHYFIRL